MDAAIIAIVKGGLGNQLFIYAAARALALRTGRLLFLDTHRGFERDGYGRSYRLDRFPIAGRPMPEALAVAPTLKHWRHKWIRSWSKCLPRDWRSYVTERAGAPVTQLTALHPRRAHVTLNGYWQDERYFADHAPTLRQELALPAATDPRNRELGIRLFAEQSVSVHIRRVRYSHPLPREYYQRAINAICDRVERPVFVLFGDDLDWPLQQLDFHGRPREIVTHNAADEVADLWLMTQCRHAIVANSSFSWWGAWLRTPLSGALTFAPAETGFAMVMPPRWEQQEPPQAGPRQPRQLT